jgi:hypothetical protein
MSTAHTLAELEQQFEAISLRASALDTAVPAFTRRPRPESWSAAECILHLNISLSPFLQIWANAIPALPPSKRESYRRDFWGWALAWFLEPPARMRIPTPAPFEPRDIGGDPMPVFLEGQRCVIELLRAARGRRLDQMKVVSPFEKRVRYSLWSSFCVNAAHERRHLWQAERAILSASSSP